VGQRQHCEERGVIETVHILGCDFGVIAVPDGHPKVEECWGSFQHDEQKIYIQTGLAEGITKETLFHEIIHAVDSMVVSDGLTEHEIFRLSVVLYATLRDNPQLLKYLFDFDGS